MNRSPRLATLAVFGAVVAALGGRLVIPRRHPAAVFAESGPEPVETLPRGVAYYGTHSPISSHNIRARRPGIGSAARRRQGRARKH